MRPTGDQEIAGSTPASSAIFLHWDYHEIFSTVIPSLLLIQEGQLSVYGERMGKLLVNRIEDSACSVKEWLGELSALDMTTLGWLDRKTPTQTKYLQVKVWHRCDKVVKNKCGPQCKKNVPSDMCAQWRLKQDQIIFCIKRRCIFGYEKMCPVKI